MIYWCAVAIAVVSLMLALSPYLLDAVFQELGTLASEVLLIAAAAATIVASRSIQTRALAAFIAVLLVLPFVSFAVMHAYAARLRIPGIFQDASIVWPQFLFFGGAVWTAGPQGRPVMPEQWSGVISIAFWMLIAWSLSAVTKRLTSFAVLFGLSIVAILLTIAVITTALPVFGWRFLLEFP